MCCHVNESFYTLSAEERDAVSLDLIQDQSLGQWSRPWKALPASVLLSVKSSFIIVSPVRSWIREVLETASLIVSCGASTQGLMTTINDWSLDGAY
jgi:hypothetical protein